MVNFRFGVVGALAIAAASFAGPQTAQAATCAGATTSFTLNTSGDCDGYSGNLNAGASLIAAQTIATANGYGTVQLIEGSAPLNGTGTYLSIFGGDPAFELPWSLTAAALGNYTNFIILLKAGSDSYGTVLFALITGTSGNYTIYTPDDNPNNNDYKPSLSHASLYGTSCGPTGSGCAPEPGQTPIPGAAFLMGSVLAGGAGFGAWRRRRREKFAA
jgi:hypothetical protein